jgi:hypothetical protein
MTSEREMTGVVRAWLEEGPTSLPDGVLDGVLDELARTPQRRAGWLTPHSAGTTRLMTIAIAAAALVIALLVGLELFGSPHVGSPSQTPGPTVRSTGTRLPDEGTLRGGRYWIGDPYPATLSFDVPKGWEACSFSTYERGVCHAEDGAAVYIGVAFLVVDDVPVDPCTNEQRQPPLGPSVDDLVAAISSLPRFEASTPIDTTVGGYPAKRFTLTAPQITNCDLQTWSTPSRTNGVGPGEENLLLVVDVDGARVMIAAAYFPRVVSDGERQAIEDLIASIEIQP